MCSQHMLCTGSRLLHSALCRTDSWSGVCYHWQSRHSPGTPSKEHCQLETGMCSRRMLCTSSHLLRSTPRCTDSWSRVCYHWQRRHSPGNQCRRKNPSCSCTSTRRTPCTVRHLVPCTQRRTDSWSIVCCYCQSFFVSYFDTAPTAPSMLCCPGHPILSQHCIRKSRCCIK